MTTFRVSNMKCVNCQKRITAAMEKEKIEADVKLENKTVTVADDKKETAAEILDGLGFDAEAV